MKLTKEEKRNLREIVDECYEQHLSSLLENIYEDFQKWGGDYINSFELTDRIHKFHDGDARELYKMYVMSPPEVAILYAIRCYMISPEGIDKNLINKLGIKLSEVVDISDEIDK